LPSGKILGSNRYIISRSGNHSSGLLTTCESVLCRCKDLSNCDDKYNKLWTNSISSLNLNCNHDLKFFIDDNSHLYITAKNVFKNDTKNIKNSNDFINILDSYVNDYSFFSDDNKKIKIK